MSTSIFLTRQQSRLVDRLAVEEYGFSGLVLMENAGRGAADVLCRLGIDGTVVVCCGKGNNAGDGFVIARHLELRGHSVRVLLWAEPEELTGDAAANFHILTKTDVPIEVFGAADDSGRLSKSLDGAAWIVDALLGTGARGEPRPPFDEVIEQLNAAAAPKLAVDLPSGLDCDAGRPAKHTIRAAETCTFLAAKPGFFTPEAKPHVGRLHVCDIGVPRKLIERGLTLAFCWAALP
ncbi:MAG: NAD(P)H-hydrate epimerase [Planctomycetes bacterium]|nr:NAD(P)H-hydrate epimerase [Planctomycetota bacterium]MBU4398267.1 NAD(P)H-hydrate epimerase [Planctomycetota bacterium]MCG2684927.1 NAD(P)H-hydrate epimerase [Planctomycetales bacterium]